jgi:hypothetical protein
MNRFPKRWLDDISQQYMSIRIHKVQPWADVYKWVMTQKLPVHKAELPEVAEVLTARFTNHTAMRQFMQNIWVST